MRTTQFVQSYFDAWNHCDSQGVADHLTADGIYCDVPQNAQRSHDELVSFLNQFFSRHRHRYELIGDILRGKDTIAFQYKVFPQGEIVKNPSPTAYRGAEFMTLHGDAAITITDYYDIPGTGRGATPGQMTSREMQARKYAKSGLSDDLMHDYKNRLVEIMQSQKLYLNPDLTLPRLAASVNCSVNHLSQVLNSGFGMSFFDYLNQFRIDDAKQLLARRGDRKSAILNIAFAVGFNSNSAFYAAFKKRVGQTPAQYRRQLTRQ